MTVAVCLECGQLKSSAWKTCPACHYQPRGVEELAKSLIVSDHWIPPEVLAQCSTRRQQGEPFAFDPHVVQLFKERVSSLLPLTPDGRLAEVEDISPSSVTSSRSPIEEIPSRTP